MPSSATSSSGLPTWSRSCGEPAESSSMPLLPIHSRTTRATIGDTSSVICSSVAGHSSVQPNSGDRIDRLEEWEAMKVGIPRDDASDAVLTHEDGRVRVVEDIARKMGNLREDLRGHLRVTLGRDEDTEAG